MGLEKLQKMEYPGRIIIIGKDISGEQVVVVYAITGRSPSSQARKIEFEANSALVKPTDEDILQTGSVDLLIYPALIVSHGITVSNGKQSTDIQKSLEKMQKPVDVLSSAMQNWDFEPDAPNFTPRISGCVCASSRAALSIVKRAQDSSSLKYYFEFPLMPGTGKMIATYTGENINPLPSFQGEPIDVKIEGQTPQAMAEQAYAAMQPDTPDKDFRVTTACVFSQDLTLDTSQVAIINRHERNNHGKV